MFCKGIAFGCNKKTAFRSLKTVFNVICKMLIVGQEPFHLLYLIINFFYA